MAQVVPDAYFKSHTQSGKIAIGPQSPHGRAAANVIALKTRPSRSQEFENGVCAKVVSIVSDKYRHLSLDDILRSGSVDAAGIDDEVGVLANHLVVKNIMIGGDKHQIIA